MSVIIEASGDAEEITELLGQVHEKAPPAAPAVVQAVRPDGGA